MSINRILHTLRESERLKIEQEATLLWLNREQELWTQGEEVTAIYLPVTAVISLLQTMDDGRSIEVAAVGNEGIVGNLSAFSSRRSLTRAVCQVGGEAWRIPVARFNELKQAIPSFDDLLSRYAYAFLREMVQSSGCNALHPLEQRFARMLLEMADRSGKNVIELSQEFIAEVLGVRRETVGLIAVNLQRSGHIAYARGRIDILDRSSLEATSCECYAILRREWKGLFEGQLSQKAA
jgi:CRP-like cAMP-binding protein